MSVTTITTTTVTTEGVEVKYEKKTGYISSSGSSSSNGDDGGGGDGGGDLHVAFMSPKQAKIWSYYCCTTNESTTPLLTHILPHC